MSNVRTGLERFCREGPSVAGLARGARVGLVGHPASIAADGTHALELLHRADGVRLERLFAPEHGMWGHEQDMETVSVSADPVSGLPVISLYGADPASLRPAAQDLEQLDAVLVDLQDVGSRYYTFVYTMAYVMEAAREADIPVVVLDRPNPIGGVALEGPVLHPELASFVGRYAIPVRHAMTSGELARLFNERFGIGCDLRLVTLESWRREWLFDRTGLPWVPPSPNMPTATTALVYPGGCLIEGTLLSEARGTTTPFELVGAPWLDAHALAASMRAPGLPGVVFRPASFRPMFQKHAGQACSGVQVIPTERHTFRPFATYLTLIAACRRQAPAAFAWRTEAYEFEVERMAIDLLLGRPDLRAALEAGEPVERLEARWSDELAEFSAARDEYLAYD
ncbi:MAG: DUF1343 domain-containing protein [bacterium]|nr:DUF1343 domain-containing protein [bacterium]